MQFSQVYLKYQKAPPSIISNTKDSQEGENSHVYSRSHFLNSFQVLQGNTHTKTTWV